MKRVVVDLLMAAVLLIACLMMASGLVGLAASLGSYSGLQ